MTRSRAGRAGLGVAVIAVAALALGNALGMGRPTMADADERAASVIESVTRAGQGPDGFGPRSRGEQCPQDAVRVRPGEDLQAAIDTAGDDGVVCISPGRHRLTSTLAPRWGSTLIFEKGAVLDGSRPVRDWQVDGEYWVTSGQTQSFSPEETPCGENPAACEYEDLFRDGRPLVRVLERSDLRSGTFYFDEAADKMYLTEDPAGHRMEATVAETAIDAGGAQNITVRGATIEKFGKHGIVSSDGWVIARNLIRYVHSHGLRVFGDTRVINNDIQHAGNMAIFADEGEGLVFEHNRLAHNNYLNFDLWHGGATKITSSVNTVVRNNWSHHNTGDGWHFDWDNAGTIVEGNLFEHNSRYGALYEASFDAVFRDNVFRHNGASAKWQGAGLWISTSRDVEVDGNTFDRNRYSSLAFVSNERGRSARYGVRETTGLWVHDNTFILEEGFVGVPFGDTAVYASQANNRFTGNRYEVPDPDGRWWIWGTANAEEHSRYSWAEWNDAGQDRDGGVGTISR